MVLEGRDSKCRVGLGHWQTTDGLIGNVQWAVLTYLQQVFPTAEVLFPIYTWFTAHVVQPPRLMMTDGLRSVWR